MSTKTNNKGFMQNPKVILITGILSLSLSWLYGFPGLFLGWLTLRNLKSAKGNTDKNPSLKYGKIFAIYGMVISSIFSLLIIFSWFLKIIGK